MTEIAKRTDCHCETERLGALSPRKSAPEARWRSGDAADCKSTDYPGAEPIFRSIPALFASRFSVGFSTLLRNELSLPHPTRGAS